MQGVILAAGQGSRLYPLTLTRSKAMLPILGKPIVERVMEGLWANGVDDFVLVVSPTDREIVEHFRCNSRLPADVRFAYQAERLGMAHALRQAAPLIEEDFVLSACDNLLSVAQTGALLRGWEGGATAALLTLMPVEPERLGSVGIVELEGNRVTRIVEKPAPEEAPSNISSLPLYVFSRRLLDYLPRVTLSPRGEYELQDAIQMLIAAGERVEGVMVERRLTLTNAADLLAINAHYLTRDGAPPTSAPGAAGPGTRLTTPLYIEEGVVIGADCSLGPRVYVERDCQIGDGVSLQDVVVLRGTVVPAGTHASGEVLA
jgi:bifunctional UDP-N-acetylglucosamine pyrophosphorylase/glucosamine-1-phosphate N-acetyltransferase